ncbi:hypothetical protein EDB89DRAFT_2068821 [Lactarius sanguifluus]|nr:hypothetical protein EDB89DRAFT_2068821 [Lactarius sanguifluus]
MEPGPAADPVVALNNILQSNPGGNIRSELNWTMTQEGPNNQAVHHAIANLRNVTLGSGQGVSKGLAKRAAAEQALAYLNEHGIPERQGVPQPEL